MKIKSDLQLKAEAMANGIQDFVTAVLNTAVVKKTMNILFISLLSIGTLGLLWLIVAIPCIPFRGEGADEWLKSFVMAYPWLAGVWLIISFGAAAFWAWTISIEPKTQK